MFLYREISERKSLELHIKLLQTVQHSFCINQREFFRFSSDIREKKTNKNAEIHTHFITGFFKIK